MTNRSPGAKFALVLAGLCLLLDGASATVLSPEQRYTGPQHLTEPSLGIGFTIPEAWFGVLPRDSEFFVMAPADEAGYIFAGADEMTPAEARSTMSQDLPLGNGITLHPTDKLSEDGRRLSAGYTVSGAQQPLAAQATTAIGERGLGIFFIAVYPAHRAAEFARALDSLVDSIRWSAPVSPPAAPAGSQFELAGKKLTRFYTGSGYSETQYLYLCHSGQFYHDFNGGGYGWNASGAFQSNSRGRWQVSGNRLVLDYADSSSAAYNLSVDDREFMMDGKRWFREVTDCR